MTDHLASVPSNGATKKPGWRPWWNKKKKPEQHDEHDQFVSWKGLLTMFGVAVVALLGMAAGFGTWVLSEAKASPKEVQTLGRKVDRSEVAQLNVNALVQWELHAINARLERLMDVAGVSQPRLPPRPRPMPMPEDPER